MLRLFPGVNTGCHRPWTIISLCGFCDIFIESLVCIACFFGKICFTQHAFPFWVCDDFVSLNARFMKYKALQVLGARVLSSSPEVHIMYGNQISH